MTASGNVEVAEAEGTADELLSLAERLFAEQGVENTPLTRIVARSRQRNRSAVHYHFGSRAGVLTAVLNRRLAALNARREALADALPARPTVAQVVRAAFAPLGEAVVEEPWGADYLSIAAQVTFHPRLLGEQGVDEAHLSGVRRCRQLLAAAAPGTPEPLLTQRLGWLIDSAVFALARWVRDTPPSARTAGAMAALLDQLAAYGAAGLVALDPSASASSSQPAPESAS